ncbi:MULTISPECIES: PD-(D/E)XK nuclease family protein [unclassified Helicobacter]|uniref:PD-(D/E)XK nuclease family protein n=1 Tax=unclassified Helicobacter TaxID=2593540 RepID=UPI000CF122CA|nr:MULTISPECIES: PD-(D/E)XK nuclease family protein [unclassified Helicobacter]
MNNKLYVFSSKRSIGEFYLQYNQSFAPRAISISEFFDFCVGVRGKKKIPAYIKKVFLLQTLYQYKNTHKLLTFDQSFLAYLEGVEFLENFFSEIDLNNKDITEIPYQDIYGDYEDHLKILQDIYKTYQEKLNHFGFYDIYCNQDYEIYDEVLNPFESIEIFLDGILSKSEQKILLQLAQKATINLHLNCDMYNKRFLNFLGLELQEDYFYKINLTSKIIEESKKKTLSHQVQSYAFQSRLDQVSFVIFKVNEWLEKGIENVALITPNEDFVRYLDSLDSYRNFNYAMGLDIKKTSYYQEIVGLQEEKLEDFEILKKRINEILEKSKDFTQEISLFNQKFFAGFEKIQEVIEQFSIQDLLAFYLRELEGVKISDTKGGKIPVYGVLETRGISFDEIVIVDFNEENIFNFKDNDLFLNTKIRKSVGMPTLFDKQNLRKHYYYQLIQQTKRVHITYKSEDRSTHFLKNLGAKAQDFSHTIFSFNQMREYVEDEFVTQIPQDFIFSASSLKSFFSCKRQFFFKYLKKLKADDESDSIKTGKLFHQLLKQSYDNFVDDFDILKVREFFYKKLNESIYQTKMEKFAAEIEGKKMFGFWENEIVCFSDSKRKFIKAEYDFNTEIFGKKIRGCIDRIDSYGNQEIIIDYKISNNVKQYKSDEKLCDFQLPIYKLALCNEDREVSDCYLYDIRNGKLIQEEQMQEKIEILKYKMASLDGTILFDKCEDLKDCMHCEFKILCNR